MDDYSQQAGQWQSTAGLWTKNSLWRYICQKNKSMGEVLVCLPHRCVWYSRYHSWNAAAYLQAICIAIKPSVWVLQVMHVSGE